MFRKMMWVAVAAIPLQASAQVPLGRVESHASGAGFTADAVWGPHINVSQRRDGSWAGVFFGRAVDLENHDGHLTGPNIDIQVDQSAGQTNVRGYFLWMHVDVHLPRGAVDGADPVKVGEQLNSLPRYRLEGAAARADRPIVPFVLALLAAS